MKAMLDRGLTEQGAADVLGWSINRVAARVKLLQLPERAQQMVGARLISAHEEITRLKAENRMLRDRLAVTLGDAWQADLTDTLPRGSGGSTPRAAEAGNSRERGGI